MDRDILIQLALSVSVVVVLVVLTGYGSTAPDATVLDGTRWTLVSLHGEPPIADTSITLNFSDGVVSGFAGCNEYRPLPAEFGSIDYTVSELLSDIRQGKSILETMRRYPIQVRYTANDDGALSMPEFMVTLKSCGRLGADGEMESRDDIMQQEQAYSDALQDAAAYRLVDDRLEIDDAAGHTILVFTRTSD